MPRKRRAKRNSSRTPCTKDTIPKVDFQQPKHLMQTRSNAHSEIQMITRSASQSINPTQQPRNSNQQPRNSNQQPRSAAQQSRNMNRTRNSIQQPTNTDHLAGNTFQIPRNSVQPPRLTAQETRNSTEERNTNLPTQSRRGKRLKFSPQSRNNANSGGAFNSIGIVCPQNRQTQNTKKTDRRKSRKHFNHKNASNQYAHIRRRPFNRYHLKRIFIKFQNHQEYDFPEEETIICANSFVNRGKIHVIGGYNFLDLVYRKYNLSREENERLTGKHWILDFSDKAKMEYEIKELDYGRLISPSCCYDESTESVYVFGGLNERLDKKKQEYDIFISRLLMIHHANHGDFTTETPELPAISPCARFFHMSAWDGDHRCFWVFGGGTTDTSTKNYLFCDLWRYSVVNRLWEKCNIVERTRFRWGGSMVYYRDRLYVFGGGGKNPRQNYAANMQIFSVENIKRVTISLVELPEKYKMASLGIQLILVEHPLKGPFIIFTGGCNDFIFKYLGFMADLKACHDKVDLVPLRLGIFNVNKKKFKLVKTPENIPNVSFHSQALLDGNLFLIGGLNHSTEGHRIFNKKILRIPIFNMIQPNYRQNLFPVVPLQTPTSSNQMPNILVEKINTILNKELEIIRSDDRITFLKTIFRNHQQCPDPISDFVVFTNVCVAKSILRMRFPVNPNKISAISWNFRRDLIYYLYTGFVKPKESKFIDFRSFLKFVKLCLKAKLYRLICFEVCIHLSQLFIQDILTLCCLTNGDPDQPICDDPNMYLLKYIMLFFFHSTAFPSNVLESVPDVELISEHLLDFLDDSRPQINLDLIEKPEFPFCTIKYDLSAMYHPQPIQCRDMCVYFDTTPFNYDFSQFAQFSSDVVTAVLLLKSRILFNIDNELVVDRFVQTFYIFNCEMSLLQQEVVDEFYMPVYDILETLARTYSSFHFQLFPLFKKIKHQSVLSLMVKLFGLDSLIYFTDNKGEIYRLNRRFIEVKHQFKRLILDIEPNTAYSIALIMYSCASPDDIPKFVTEWELMAALLAVCGDHPWLLHDGVHSSCVAFIRKILFKDLRIDPEFALKNAKRLFNLGLIDDALEISEPQKWIPKLTDPPNYRFENDFRIWIVRANIKLRSFPVLYNK